MSAGTDRQAAGWGQRAQVYAACIALVGVVLGALLGFAGQSILAARALENERENRLWRERVSAYGSFEAASYAFMRAAHDSDPDELRIAHERVRAGLGPISILAGGAVAEAARLVHLAASVIFSAEKASEQQLDELSAARVAFMVAAGKELGVPP